MFKLITATLAATFVVLYVFGAQDRRVDVSRNAPADAAGFTLATFNSEKIESTRLPSRSFGVSDEDAIHIALQSGADIRSGRTSKPLYGVVAAVDAAGIAAAKDPLPIDQQAVAMWYVTGSSVNLRAGPGTANAVVGKLGYGAEAEVLSDEGGWYQIRTANGDVSGWIFGKFLTDNRPG